MVTSEEQAAITKARLRQDLSDSEISFLRELASEINRVLPEEGDCEQEDEFSIVHYGRHFTRGLNNHRGELSTAERTALLELIEAAAEVMRFY